MICNNYKYSVIHSLDRSYFYQGCFFFILFLLLFASCKVDKTEEKINNINGTDTINIKYAKGFKVYKKDYLTYALDILIPGENQIIYSYKLTKSKTNYSNKKHLIPIPAKTTIPLSSIYLGYLNSLGLANRIVAVSKFDYVNTTPIREMIKDKKIEEVGELTSLNMEKVISLHPNIIFSYGSDNSVNDIPAKLSSTEIPIIITTEQFENSPLARAEWIKFIALFFDKLELADSLFNQIEKEYLKIKSMASNTDYKPTVFTGIRYGDAWPVAGGQSYIAQILKDAGSNYLWQDDVHSRVSMLSFESVYAKSVNADYWLNTGSFHSITELVSADTRYNTFNATKTQNIYNNNKRENEFGGDDFFESGPVQPHIILKDLVKIFHPELLPEYELYYYRQLK